MVPVSYEQRLLDQVLSNGPLPGLGELSTTHAATRFSRGKLVALEQDWLENLLALYAQLVCCPSVPGG
jgi:hypothetical protein